MSHIVTSAPTASALVVFRRQDHSGATGDEKLIQLWLAQKSPKTQGEYRRDSSRLLAHLRGLGRDLRTATLVDVQSYVEAIEGAISTKARTVASMKSLFSFGYRTGYLGFDVGRAIRAPKVPNNLAERIVSEEDVIRMITTAMPGRDRTLVRLLYVAGVRVSEAEGIRWRHVHSRGESAQITVHGKGGKTRHVLLTPTVAKELAELRGDANDDEPVFRSRTGRALGKRDIQRIVKTVAKKAGLKARVSPHFLRHAHASHALDRGAPIHLVQQDLGHASVATTSKYLHARPDDGSARFLVA